MHWQVIKRDEQRDVLWKNGGGFTREIYVEPSRRDAAFGFRLSLATVSQSGPFSLFAGLDRTIVQLSGEAMTLVRQDSSRVSLKIDAPYTFRGEDKIDCHLADGEATDWNLMVARDEFSASVAMLSHLGDEGVLKKGSYRIIYVIAGVVVCKIADQVVELTTAETLIVAVEAESLAMSVRPCTSDTRALLASVEQKTF